MTFLFQVSFLKTCYLVDWGLCNRQLKEISCEKEIQGIG